ncbi:MAG: hypothetical protein B6D39_07585 [Anaerolineae bacterium UTCFX2]|jgi:predicted ArsR family transcriptional regulator|nr:helix-turn-helix domain-containing protein [Anaerolineales bacterium]OQY90911.1 MAG: hypothetical protein B6D39_07585 [Anaerolineae bacterium UTCFX2]
MKTVRQRILEFIRSQRAVSVQELTQAFRMTEQNIRYHLSILKSEGVIEEIEGSSPQKRGRPKKVYGPARHTYGENLDLLASTLLELLLSNAGEDQTRRIYDRLAQGLAQKMASNLGLNLEATPRPGYLTQRLNRLTAVLNEHHYFSRWEAHSDAPRVVLGHCPFAAVIAEHPEVCSLDAGLISTLLDQPVQQTAKLAKGADGLPYCLFRVEKKQV